MTKHARLLFVLSIFLLSLVVIDFVKLSSNDSSNRVAQVSKPNLIAKVNEIGQVLNENTTTTYYYKFYLKDSTASQINSTTKDTSSYISGATVTVSNQSSFHCGDTGTSFSFAYYDGLYKLVCQEAGNMQIRISKSGYSTKNVTVAYYQGEIPTIYLSKYVASPPAPPPAPPETIKTITLPSVFKDLGSETTDLTKVTDTAKVDNLVLDAKIASIKYSESVDLSATDTKDKFKVLDKYVKIEQIGEVALDSVNLPALNKKATITMKSLGYVKTPKVLVDGKEDKSVVSNVTYKNGVLTFDVTHFSTFTAAPTVGISEPANNFETKDSQITLKGTVSDPTASVSAKLNNKSLGKLKIATNGAFQKEVDLEEGLNKIVVSALGVNLAAASATVSGTLLKGVNSLTTPLSLLLALLGILGIAGIVWSLKHLKKNVDAKKKVVTKPADTTPPTTPLG